ncbi:lysyl oxidase homolog 2 [Spodoptera frugiperda]|uniref:protein-lysine 6-oxidase n=1 Tax=Spodoptera frugiperda TaxID=7108 RepID=A0A9R0EYU2_SPOFR|nr:lysyl oxidase homolog 2 [Spodoptera frugiperda]
MLQLKYTMNLIVLIILLIRTVKVFGKNVNEHERALRAEFVQNLLNKQNKFEGRIKLVGGSSKYEGNVYIYHAGRWGAVCDDNWDDEAAAVVCRSFNLSGIATIGSQYGEAIERFWLDDVICQGDETSLSKCVFNRWGSTDCEKDEVAGVICMEEEELPARHKDSDSMSLAYNEERLRDVIDVSKSKLRLTGGKNIREGRVEIFLNGSWGSICPDGWTVYEASAVCRHLGMGFAEQALQTYIFGFSNIILSGVSCEGNESSLFDCKHKQRGNVKCPGDIGHTAAVVCTHFLADLVLDTAVIERSAHLQDVMMFQLQCAMEENCLSRTAYEVQKLIPDWQYETRRLLRFTASSLNAGNAEFRPYLPKHLWQWHLCHMHYHSMEVFATFDVLDYNGLRVAEGHKASFCLEDNTCLNGVQKQYSCKNYGDQGISVNCSDVYMYNIDCQWVDVTDVKPGDYHFKVAVNPHARVAEQNYHNNAALCNLRLTTTYALVYGCRHERP